MIAVFAAAGVADIRNVIAVGGDYLHGRLLLPGVFALCAPVAVVPWMRRYGVALLAAPWVFATVLVLAPPAGTRSGARETACCSRRSTAR